MNPEEFKSLLSEMAGLLWQSAAAIMPTQADAQDVVSDAVEKLWRNRERMAGQENPRGFMITVVKRTALDALRHQKRHPQVDIDVTPASAAVDEESVEKASDMALVRQLMLHLPDNQRLVLEMSVFMQLDIEEICSRTGLSTTNVRVLLSRGRKRLRKDFAKYNN